MTLAMTHQPRTKTQIIYYCADCEIVADDTNCAVCKGKTSPIGTIEHREDTKGEEAEAMEPEYSKGGSTNAS